MAFYNDRKKVLEFTYRDVPVTIINAMRGASCCGQDRRASAVLCPSCGKRLKHLPVTLVMVRDKVILELKRVTPLHARRKAEVLIDRLYSEIDRDRPPNKGDQGQDSGKKDGGKGGGRKTPPPALPPPADSPPDNPPSDDESSDGKPPPVPPGSPFGDKTPPKRRRPGSKAGSDGPEVPPLPPGFDLEIVGVIGQDDAVAFAQLVEAVKHLGWGEQVKQILDDISRRGQPN